MTTLRAALGVLAGKGEALPDKASSALAELAACGLKSPPPALAGLIRLSLVHHSYLYENQALLPGVSQKHLDALAKIGNAFQRKQTAADAFQRYGTSVNGSLSSETARVGTLFHEWAAGLDWLRASALLGKTFLGVQTLPRKVTTGLLQQVIGTLCLVGKADIAAELLTRLLSQAHDDARISDPKTLLQEILPFEMAASFSYQVSASGPEHDATFHAVISDPPGRSGSGRGTSKTAACQAATLDLIRTHFADLVPSTKPEATYRGNPDPISGNEGHSRQIARVQELFGLQPSALGLLSQALIHKSWAFEHQTAAKDARQRDNAALAFVGSCALEYEYVAAVARAAIASEDPGKQGIISQRNSAYAEAFQITGMADGLLLGAGQARTTNITTALASDSFQAVFAAVSAGRGFPATLMDSWPAPWSAARELIAPSQARPEDARSRLESVTGRMRLPVSYEYDHQGKEHVRLYRCTITLESEATGKSVTVAGTFAQSKGEAKDRAAEQVLAVFDSLAEGQPAPADEATRDIVRFLAAHQAAVSARQAQAPGEPSSPEVSPP